ncbi:SH3 domain-containing protein [Flavobacterium aquidurense]|uniref:SH3b domain-containing protein n=1 Tax=Flavobacterium frigidimaris TaxID=262320 RepID=A0ABX4BKL4_FLAFR|nr:SH3 domain-containing protein [Flavobacterium frigidimaris]OXA76305.1 hypothetical protein B0A65_19175 [Flavobacterium frigidimaris]SDY20131.1 SH3 domain-containing protein [Flavobacterium aquidurense]
MNKLIALIILSLFISCTSKSQSKEATIADLKIAFTKNDEKLFLQNFPKNYNQFVKYFGWNDSLDVPYPLYNESEEYINRLFKIIKKDKTGKSLKLIIDIGINGKYQADAVNYFKINIERIFKENPNLACDLLGNRTLEEIDSFWHFYLDSPQPLTAVPDIFKILKNSCPQIYSSLEKELTLIQKENLVSEITNESKTNKLKLINDFIPEGYTILDSLSGYINDDNLTDKILILANSQEFKNNESRILLILLYNQNKEYSLNFKSSNIIPCLKCAGGTGGEDSYDDLSFNNNILSFIQLKISDSNLIKIKYEFLNNKSDFKLDRVTTTSSELNNDFANTVSIKLNTSISLRNFNYQDYKSYLNYSVIIADLDGFTNLRKEKKSSSIILEKIKTGENVKVIDNSGDWWFVQTKEGKKGYVCKTKIKNE